MARPAALVLAIAMLVAAGCSDDDGGLQGSSGTPTTETSATPATVAGVTSTSPVLTSSTPTTIARALTTTAPPGTAASPATTAGTAGPAVAEAGGWRLVVSQPARATIPPAAVLCYEATGASREPELELEVTALPPGTIVRVPVQVGRGTARVDLTAAGAGARDLRIQLVVNGQRIDGLAVTVPVTIAAGAPAATC